MYKKISKTEKIDKRLKAEGKYEVLNSEKELQKILEINKNMEEIRRDYTNKSAMSWRSIENLILKTNYSSK